MEELFLNIINCLSESRYWLGPVLIACIYIIVVLEIIHVFRSVQKEMEED